MNTPNTLTEREMPLAAEIVLCIAALAILVWLMYWTYTSWEIGGSPTGIWSFIGFWLRELLLLAFITFGAMAFAVYWIWKSFRRVFIKRP